MSRSAELCCQVLSRISTSSCRLVSRSQRLSADGEAGEDVDGEAEHETHSASTGGDQVCPRDSGAATRWATFGPGRRVTTRSLPVAVPADGSAIRRVTRHLSYRWHSMALQNRVDPFGAIHAVTNRGTMLGNRGGCMHRDKQLVGRPWSNERWICCVLEFKGRRRPELMAPGLYTELFFLDEATAFAAGHRPCMECRRADANRFIDAWSRAHLPLGQRPRTVSHIDAIAHRERVDPKTWRQRTALVRLSTLPDGVLITLENAPSVIAAGARSVAVISDLVTTGDPAGRVREYVARLERI